MSSNNDPNQAKTRAASYMLLIKDNQTFLIKRSNTGYRDGEWSLPAGKVDAGESFTEAAVREAFEEVGVTVDAQDMHYALTMHRKSDNAPGEAWVDVMFVCHEWLGEPHNAEPHKHGEGAWFGLDALPQELMEYQHALINAYNNKQTYFEFGWKEGEYA
jgi:8-oxo-dGTP pyrophosphatase MutT (NUDIX family)